MVFYVNHHAIITQSSRRSRNLPDALYETEEVWKMVQKNGRVALSKQVRRAAKPAAPVDTHAHMATLITSLQQQLRSAMTLNPCEYVFNLE